MNSGLRQLCTLGLPALLMFSLSVLLLRQKYRPLQRLVFISVPLFIVLIYAYLILGGWRAFNLAVAGSTSGMLMATATTLPPSTPNKKR